MSRAAAGLARIMVMLPPGFVLLVLVCVMVRGERMMHTQFLRIKKLTGKAVIQAAARHNYREILAKIGATQDGHIDPSRVRLNYVLRGLGTAAGAADMAQSLLDNAGIKTLRKDAVRALEIIFSLPPQSSIYHQRYFEDSTQWTERYFQAPVSQKAKRATSRSV